MNTAFTEDHELFRKVLRDFVTAEITPYVLEWEAAGEIPARCSSEWASSGSSACGFRKSVVVVRDATSGTRRS